MLEDAPVLLFGSAQGFERLDGVVQLIVHSVRYWRSVWGRW
jgi:hypothetical protein